MPRTFTLPRGAHIAPFTPARSDAEWVSVNGSPRRDMSIGESYRVSAGTRSARLQPVGNDAPRKCDARVFGEAKTRPLWDGTMTPKLQEREAAFTKRGTCPDRL